MLWARWRRIAKLSTSPRSTPHVASPPARDASTAVEAGSLPSSLGAVWRATSLPDGLAAQVHARTGGNALFNEELARGLAEDGKITVTGGRAVLTGALAP